MNTRTLYDIPVKIKLERGINIHRQKLVLFVIILIIIVGLFGYYWVLDKSNINSKDVKYVSLECIQECLKQNKVPFSNKQFIDKKSIDQFLTAVNKAKRIEGSLDYGVDFLMTITMSDGKQNKYYLNIGNTERPKNGLLIKLPDTEKGYSISEKTSEKLKQIIYKS